MQKHKNMTQQWEQINKLLKMSKTVYIIPAISYMHSFHSKVLISPHHSFLNV